MHQWRNEEKTKLVEVERDREQFTRFPKFANTKHFPSRTTPTSDERRETRTMECAKRRDESDER